MVNKPEPQRVATLLTVIGQDALIVYNAFNWPVNEERTVELVLSKFGAYCQPKKYVIDERFSFMSRKQKATESMTDYVVALRNSAKHCNYGQLTDTLIRDAIVMGIRSKKTLETLLKEGDMTLDKCVNIVHFIIFKI